ncbi:hypothetical protein B0E53_06742 [Micromonospora sp. MH33]|nr:hypothetical protein B0E53_06742 [Micromonospora sp. MH33]
MARGRCGRHRLTGGRRTRHGVARRGRPRHGVTGARRTRHGVTGGRRTRHGVTGGRRTRHGVTGGRRAGHGVAGDRVAGDRDTGDRRQRRRRHRRRVVRPGLGAARQLPRDGRLLTGGGRVGLGRVAPLGQRVDRLAVRAARGEAVTAGEGAGAGQVGPGRHRAAGTGVGRGAGAVARRRVEGPPAQGDLVAGGAGVRDRRRGVRAVPQRGQGPERRGGAALLRAGDGREGRRQLATAGEGARHQDRGGQRDVGDGAPVGTGPQLDLDAVPGGQPGDHDEAHHPGDRDVHLRRRGQPLVQLAQLLVADADAPVLHVEGGAVAHPPGLHHDVRVRRGEGGGVVEQLGDQVHQVVDRVRGDLDVPVDDAELDPGVVLDLGLGGA